MCLVTQKGQMSVCCYIHDVLTEILIKTGDCDISIKFFLSKSYESSLAKEILQLLF